MKGQDYRIGLKNSEVRLRHMIIIMNIMNSEVSNDTVNKLRPELRVSSLTNKYIQNPCLLILYNTPLTNIKYELNA
jgi:hypothetical protein